MDDPKRTIEIFETDGGALLVFLGTWGSEGVMVLRADQEPEFFPRDSAVWDAHHQGAYRNARATPVSREELEQRGVAIPPLDPYWGRPAVAWEDNFDAAVAREEVPAILRAKVEGADVTAYVVMFEDTYESSQGDGRFVYAEAACWDAASAQAYIEQRRAENPETAKWYRFSVKEVRLVLDRERGELRAALGLERYERLDVKELLALLTASAGPGG